jgi:hypothetical protein
MLFVEITASSGNHYWHTDLLTTYIVRKYFSLLGLLVPEDGDTGFSETSGTIYQSARRNTQKT